MLAILSDIHANLEALQAVMHDIECRKIDQIYCLGDIVGYGPDPSACVDHCKSYQLCIAGNWDKFVGNSIGDKESHTDRLREQHTWARSHLSEDQVNFLATLNTFHTQERLSFAHGSPLDHVNGYVFPEAIYEQGQMGKLFDAFDGIFICGHTHLPGVHRKTNYYEPASIENRFVPDGQPAIVNVGSVGQPRDNDSRACYVVYDGDCFEFIRLDYDIETTKQKIRDLGWLPP